MSDNGFRILEQLKQKRHNEMPSNYCRQFVQEIFKKYDHDSSNLISCKQLHNEWCSKHKRANLDHFSAKYSQIVQSLTHKQHSSPFLDKMQLYQECKTVYQTIRDQHWHDRRAKFHEKADQFVYQEHKKCKNSC